MVHDYVEQTVSFLNAQRDLIFSVLDERRKPPK